MRGDAEYRFQLAENTLRKFYFDATGEPTYERTTTPPLSNPKSRIGRDTGNGEHA